MCSGQITLILMYYFNYLLMSVYTHKRSSFMKDLGALIGFTLTQILLHMNCKKSFGQILK